MYNILGEEKNIIIYYDYMSAKNKSLHFITSS